jgi:hypothetical protein
VAYLYDLDRLGNAGLITHAPVTWLGTGSGDRGVDVALPATAYDLPAGHSLTLVVDTWIRSTTTTMRRAARSRSPAVPTSTSR